ncbi:MAG: FeoB-associated Cys-rich membrane protein [Eubacteriales bacterium]
MIEFFVSNLATILLTALIIVLAVLVIIKLIKDRKKVGCSCGSSCPGCRRGEDTDCFRCKESKKNEKNS